MQQKVWLCGLVTMDLELLNINYFFYKHQNQNNMRAKTQFVVVLLGLLFSGFMLQAQDKRTVTGVIKDNAGVELAGSSVTENGTKNRVWLLQTSDPADEKRR